MSTKENNLTKHIKKQMMKNIMLKTFIILLIFLSLPIYAEKEKEKVKTGWRKAAADFDDASSDADDAIDKAVDKATKKIIGHSAGDKVGKAKNALGVVDDLLDIEDKVMTVIEGIEEGDAAKVSSVVVGQDTADKISAKDAKEYEKEESKTLTAKEAEVRQALKAKLRRKGATKEEAEAAMKKYDNGDKKGFRNAVKEIKKKGIKDKEQSTHGLTADGKNDDEFNLKDQLYEGAKTTAKKVDDLFGGTIQKRQASDKELKKLNKEQDQTQRGIQDEVDNAVVKKMMRKGIPYKQARAAIDAKRKGHPEEFNKIAKQLAKDGKEDPSKNEGLSAAGKTSTFESDDYGEDIIDKEAQAWKDRSKKMMRAPNKVLEYLDKKDLAEKDEQQRENNAYKVFRKAGATKQEARAAANDYSKGNPEKAIKLAKTLRERKAKLKAEKAANDLFDDKNKNATKSVKVKDAADDIFANKHDKGQSATAENNKNLRDNEYSDDYVDLPDDDQKDTAEMAILRKELKRQKENAFSAEVNKSKNEMADAATSGDQTVRDSQTKIDQANTEGEEIKVTAADKSTADYNDNSFGEQMSTEVTEGIKQGFETAGTAVGTAIGQAMARKIVGDKHREDRREEWQGGDGAEVNGDKVAESSGGGKGQRQVSSNKGTRRASNTGRIRKTSGNKPKNSGSCPMCNVGKMGPWRNDNPTYLYRFCRLCGYKQIRQRTSAEPASAPGTSLPEEPTKTTEISQPAPKPVQSGMACPKCGTYNKIHHTHALYGDVYHCSKCGTSYH